MSAAFRIRPTLFSAVEYDPSPTKKGVPSRWIHTNLCIKRIWIYFCFYCRVELRYVHTLTLAYKPIDQLIHCGFCLMNRAHIYLSDSCVNLTNVYFFDTSVSRTMSTFFFKSSENRIYLYLFCNSVNWTYDYLFL